MYAIYVHTERGCTHIHAVHYIHFVVDLHVLTSKASS